MRAAQASSGGRRSSAMVVLQDGDAGAIEDFLVENLSLERLQWLRDVMDDAVEAAKVKEARELQERIEKLQAELQAIRG